MEAIGSKKKHNFCPDKLNIEGKEITGNSNIAHAFNSHFSSIARKVRDSVTPTDRPLMNFYLI